MIERSLAILTILAAPLGAHSKTLYDPRVGLIFSHQDRQSVWAPGTAAETSGTEFVGA